MKQISTVKITAQNLKNLANYSIQKYQKMNDEAFQKQLECETKNYNDKYNDRFFVKLFKKQEMISSKDFRKMVYDFESNDFFENIENDLLTRSLNNMYHCFDDKIKTCNKLLKLASSPYIESFDISSDDFDVLFELDQKDPYR